MLTSVGGTLRRSSAAGVDDTTTAWALAGARPVPTAQGDGADEGGDDARGGRAAGSGGPDASSATLPGSPCDGTQIVAVAAPCDPWSPLRRPLVPGSPGLALPQPLRSASSSSWRMPLVAMPEPACGSVTPSHAEKRPPASARMTRHRGDVPQRGLGVDHGVDAAGGDEGVAVAVAPGAQVGVLGA